MEVLKISGNRKEESNDYEFKAFPKMVSLPIISGVISDNKTNTDVNWDVLKPETQSGIFHERVRVTIKSNANVSPPSLLTSKTCL